MIIYCSVFSKDVRLPVQMQRAMAAEAESAREARAKVGYYLPRSDFILQFLLYVKEFLL